jgi:hypothetical protein
MPRFQPDSVSQLVLCFRGALRRSVEGFSGLRPKGLGLFPSIHGQLIDRLPYRSSGEVVVVAQYGLEWGYTRSGVGSCVVDGGGEG